MKKLRPINITNTIMKLFFFFAFPSAWATGFSGVKYLCQQIHSGKPLELTAFLTAFIALAVFTIVFGRFFCGRACAFGTYGDILFELAKLVSSKLHIRIPAVPRKATAVLRYMKYAVLTMVCLLCIFGYSAELAGGSPWTAFSNLRQGKLAADGIPELIGLVLFCLCSVAMMTTERFFCRFLCPFGAVFSLLPVLPMALIKRDREACLKGCSACMRVCPASLELPYRGDAAGSNDLFMGECFQCGKCTHICPKSNAKSMILRGGSKGIIADVIKALLLAVLLYKVI